ncbi:ABC transporter substrate-binding protein [Curtobacterium aetherium]|uniref:ABC transporter substrate-binding protein n=1 Tax=Curtobacterium aetherium TaxID=2841594 RepID=UPI003B516B80
MDIDRRLFLLGGTGVLLLAGCSTRPERTEVADWPTGPPEGPATISWWAGQVASKDGGDLRRRLIAAFQQEYPDIRVRIVSAPSDTDTNRTSLTTQIAAGSPTPDVYLGDVAWPGQFAKNKLATPVSSLVGEDFFDQFPEGLRQAASVDGTYYMFPLYIDESFFLYREDLLDKHGFQVPRSWEEVRDTAAKLVDTGDVSYGFAFQGDVYEGLTCNVTEFVADAGGSLLDDELENATTTSSETRRAFEFMRSLVTSGASPRATLTYQEQDTNDAFSGGRAAFLRNWSYAWGIANGPDSAVRGKVGLAARPTFDGMDEHHSTIGGWGNYINPHTQQPAAALTFARWMSSETAQQLLTREGGVLPARSASLVSEDAKRQQRPTYDTAAGITLVPRPTSTAYYPKVSQGVYQNGNGILGGQRTVDGGTSAMASAIDLALRGAAL